MAEAALITSALTTADVNVSINHEPRILDIRLAEALGFSQPRDIRKIVERHKPALERFGPICATVAQNTNPHRRGRPGRAFWLNKRQALYICTKSETTNATDVTIEMVEVFDQVTRGQVPAPKVRTLPSPSTKRLTDLFAEACATANRWDREGLIQNHEGALRSVFNLLQRHQRKAA